MAPGAVTAFGQRAGVMLQSSKHADKVMKATPHVKDFIEAAAVTGPPAMTFGGSVGYVAGEVYDNAKRK
ncbi:MAG: hypothetical protein DELT_01678 [Desulfovibrio sp.]